MLFGRNRMMDEARFTISLTLNRTISLKSLKIAKSVDLNMRNEVFVLSNAGEQNGKRDTQASLPRHAFKDC